MRKNKAGFLLVLTISVLGVFSSCASYLDVKGIAYQSIRAKDPVDNTQIPEKAKIIIAVLVDNHGYVNVEVQNNTDEIMTIDRTKSFFTGCDGISIVYYDPTVNVLTQSTTSGQTIGGSVNLGSVANAVGIGGISGSLLSGINVAAARNYATTTTNSTYIIDQPKISIAPHGKALMGRDFQETSFDIERLAELAQNTTSDINQSYVDKRLSPYSCTVTVSYSIDDEKTYDKIEVVLFVNSYIVSRVTKKGNINDALRTLYMEKKDLFDEDWYTLCFGGEPWTGYLSGVSKTGKCNAFKINHSLFYNFK